MKDIAEEYAARLVARSDIRAHMPVLRALAAQTPRGLVAEFGVRTGNSTAAFMMGLADRGGGTLHGYDILPNRAELVPPPHVHWTFTQADTGSLEEIPDVDLLFVDSWHSGDHVRLELRMETHVRHTIVFHDTVLFGLRAQGRKGGGILEPIAELVAKGEWEVRRHYTDDNGLLVLARLRQAYGGQGAEPDVSQEAAEGAEGSDLKPEFSADGADERGYGNAEGSNLR